MINDGSERAAPRCSTCSSSSARSRRCTGTTSSQGAPRRLPRGQGEPAAVRWDASRTWRLTHAHSPSLTPFLLLYRLTRLLLPHYAPTTGKASAADPRGPVSLVVNQPAAAAALLTQRGARDDAHRRPAPPPPPPHDAPRRRRRRRRRAGGRSPRASTRRTSGARGAAAAGGADGALRRDGGAHRRRRPAAAAHADARRALYKAFTSEAIESLNTAALGVPARSAPCSACQLAPRRRGARHLSEDGLLHQIATQLPNADASELAPMLQCACAWGRAARSSTL